MKGFFIKHPVISLMMVSAVCRSTEKCVKYIVRGLGGNPDGGFSILGGVNLDIKIPEGFKFVDEEGDTITVEPEDIQEAEEGKVDEQTQQDDQ